jgi:hypothetical protein
MSILVAKLLLFPLAWLALFVSLKRHKNAGTIWPLFYSLLIVTVAPIVAKGFIWLFR